LEVAAALEVMFSHKIVSNRFKVAHKLVWITPVQNVYAGPSPGFSSRGGQKPEGGAKFLKYSIGCMSQPGGQTWNRGASISNGGGRAPLALPLATALRLC